jgi:hypothetical protein
MEEKQIFEILFIIGIMVAILGVTLMWFGIAPVPMRITIVILGVSLIALSNPNVKLKKI